MTRSLLFAAVLVLSAGPGFALDYKLGSLEIKQPWTRATPKGAAVAGGYLKITNTGSTADRLTGGSLTAAGRIGISRDDHGRRSDEDASPAGRP